MLTVMLTVTNLVARRAVAHCSIVTSIVTPTL